MTESNLRTKLACDGMSHEQIEELLNELAEVRNDEARDRAAEEHFKGKNENSDHTNNSV